MKIILDTNFLIYCAEQRIDYKFGIDMLLNEYYELVVPIQVLHELGDLKKSKKKSIRRAAKIAIELIYHNNIEIIDSKGKNADEAIIKLSKGNIIATLDKEIRDKVERVITVSKDKKFRLME